MDGDVVFRPAPVRKWIRTIRPPFLCNIISITGIAGRCEIYDVNPWQFGLVDQNIKFAGTFYRLIDLNMQHFPEGGDTFTTPRGADKQGWIPKDCIGVRLALSDSVGCGEMIQKPVSIILWKFDCFYPQGHKTCAAMPNLKYDEYNSFRQECR